MTVDREEVLAALRASREPLASKWIKSHGQT